MTVPPNVCQLPDQGKKMCACVRGLCDVFCQFQDKTSAYLSVHLSLLEHLLRCIMPIAGLRCASMNNITVFFVFDVLLEQLM